MPRVTHMAALVWGKAGAGAWQKVGGPCDVCGPEGCDHTHPPTGLEQSLDEMAFARSACAAALEGQTSKLQTLIASNPSCVYHDGAGGGSGYTPLHYAARNGHADCAQLLLRSKASLLARTRGGATPLMRAAFAGHTDVCALLLRHGASGTAQDADGETALHKAAAQQHVAAYTALLAACPEASELTDRHGKRASERMSQLQGGAEAPG